MKILYYSGWLLTRIISKIVFRIKVSGKENIPKTGGFILAANHTSYFDPLLVGSWSTRQVYFFAKKELFNHKLFGEVLRRVNALPVRRAAIDRQAIGMAVDVIKRGYGLTIFPEGTRSKGDSFLAPKAGVGVIARQTKSSIIPCYVHGANRLSKCLWGRQRLSVTFGEPLSSTWVSSFSNDKESNIKVAQAVMKRIARLKEFTQEKDNLPKKENNPTENKKKRKKRLKIQGHSLYNKATI